MLIASYPERMRTEPERAQTSELDGEKASRD